MADFEYLNGGSHKDGLEDGAYRGIVKDVLPALKLHWIRLVCCIAAMLIPTLYGLILEFSNQIFEDDTHRGIVKDVLPTLRFHWFELARWIAIQSDAHSNVIWLDTWN